MFDKRHFGYQNLFSDRDSVSEAIKYFSEVLDATNNGPDKAGVMTGAFVLTNTLAKMTTCLANALEANLAAGARFQDGRSAADLSAKEFLELYRFPFEADALAQLVRSFDENSSMSQVIEGLPVDVRVYLIMALPNQEEEDDA